MDAPDYLCLDDVASERLLIEHGVQRVGNVMAVDCVERLELKLIEHDDDGDDLVLVRVIMVQSPLEAMEWLFDCCCCLHLLLPMHPMNLPLGSFARRSTQDP